MKNISLCIECVLFVYTHIPNILIYTYCIKNKNIEDTPPTSQRINNMEIYDFS